MFPSHLAVRKAVVLCNIGEQSFVDKGPHCNSGFRACFVRCRTFSRHGRHPQYHNATYMYSHVSFVKYVPSTLPHPSIHCPVSVLSRVAGVQRQTGKQANRVLP